MKIVSKKLGCVLLASILIFSIIVGFGSVAGEEDPPEPMVPFSHTVFVEELTGTWCQYCPSAAETLNNIYHSGDYDFYFVALIEDVNDDANERCTSQDQYNVGGYPTVHFDGGYRSELGGQSDETDYRNAIEDCGERAVPNIDVRIDVYDIGSATLEISVNITNNENEEYGGHLRTYITEILSRYINYDGNPYHYGFLDYAFNEPITIAAGSFWSNSIIWVGADNQDSLGNDFGDIIPENIMVQAAVFNDEPNPKFQPDVFVAYYVDESAVAIPTLPPNYGVGISPGTQSHTVSPGQSTIFNLNVENTGEVEDGFSLTKSGDQSDWATLSNNWISVESGSSQDITLEVNVPGDATEGSYDISVTATSNGDPTQTATATTTSVVSTVVTYGVSLFSSLTSKTVFPGESAVYTITLQNTGNSDDTIDMTKSGIYSEWGILSKTSVSLIAGASEDITLTVNVPSDATAGEYTISVLGTSQGDSSKSDEISTITTVEAFTYGVDLTPEYQEKTLETEDSHTFTITVTNTGNTQEAIDLTVTGSAQSWT
jgi:uncharacterized membrane protein